MNEAKSSAYYAPNTGQVPEPGITSRIKNLKDAISECHSQMTNIEGCLQEAGLFHPEPKSISTETPPAGTTLESNLSELGRFIANLQARLSEVSNSVVKLTR